MHRLIRPRTPATFLPRSHTPSRSPRGRLPPTRLLSARPTLSQRRTRMIPNRVLLKLANVERNTTRLNNTMRDTVRTLQHKDDLVNSRVDVYRFGVAMWKWGFGIMGAVTATVSIV